MTGYRAALWDKIPDSWRLAAKQCKCKELMINNIYKDMMTYVNNKCLEAKKRSPTFVDKQKKEYLKTSFNENSPFCWAFKLGETLEGYPYWEVVNKWINWFKESTK